MLVLLAAALVATAPAWASTNLLPRRLALHGLALAVLGAALPRRRGQLAPAWAAFLALLVGGWALSPVREASLPGLLDALAAVGVVLGVAAAPLPRRALAQVLVGVALLGAAVGLVQQWLPFDWGAATRPAGLFASRVTAGGVMAAALPLTCLVLRRRPGWLVPALAVEAAFLVSTRTRGAWAAGALALLAVALLAPALRRALALGLLGALALTASLTPGPRLRWTSPSPYADSAAGLVGARVGDRLDLWKETARLAATRPLLGFGAGSFEAAFAARATLPASLAGVRVESPHDEPLRLAFELGLPALAARLVAARPGRRRAALPTRLLQVALGALAVCGLSAKTGTDPPTLALGCVLLGLVLRTPRRPGRARWPLAGLAVAVAGLALALDAPAVLASRRLAEARTAQRQGDLRRAWELAEPALGPGRDLGAWLWALDLLDDAGDRTRARALAERALKAFPDHPVLLRHAAPPGTL